MRRLVLAVLIAVFASITPAAIGANYPSMVLGDSPRAYYRLGESVGAAVASDSAPNRLDGSYHNVQPGADGAPLEELDTAASFTAATDTIGNDEVRVPVTSTGPLAFPFTVEAFVRTTTAGRVVVAETLDGRESRWSIEVSSAVYAPGLTSNPFGRVVATVNLGDGLRRWAYGTLERVDDGDWHHVVVIFRSTSTQVWVNAFSSTEPNVTGMLNNPIDPERDPDTVGVTIGDAADGVAFNGMIDDVSFFNGELSQARVEDHFDSANPADGDDLGEDDGDTLPFPEPGETTESGDPEPFSPTAVGSGTQGVTIDRDAIAAYARQYVGTFHDVKGRLNDPTGWNTGYRYWIENDCTNFVSQALIAGGWPLEAIGPAIEQWAYLPESQSFSWYNAKGLVRYIARNPERGTFLQNIWSVRVGDIIFADFQRRDRPGDVAKIEPYHAMVVTSKRTLSDGRLFVGVTYHTRNRLNKSLRALIRENQGAKYWPVRLADSL